MIRTQIFRSVRSFHAVFLKKNLPLHTGIYFHNILERDCSEFERLLDFFQKENYIFCDPEQYLNTDGKKRIFLSFDDNHREWLNVGHILNQRGIKATFYCNSGSLRDIADTSKIRDYLRRIDYNIDGVTLASDEVVYLHKEYNQIIGGHTVNHYNLAAIPVSDAKEEILANKEHLERIIGTKVEHFSYPFGMRRFFTQELRDFCIEVGFKTISNAIPGLLHEKTDKYNIARTMWDFNKSLHHNIVNLRIDGRLFTGFTGKSSISYH